MTLRLSVCIDAVLAKLPLPDACALVASAGIPAIEFWKWWERDLDEVHRMCAAHDLQVAATCTKFVSLVDPSVRKDYLQGLRESLVAARQLGCHVLISQVGDAIPGVDRAVQRQSLVEGLREAAKILEGSDVRLAIEPLNVLVDHPGYFLVASDEAFDMVREVDSPHIAVTYDIYHQQISEGHLIHRIEQNIDCIAHFHAAGNPGRHELTRGEINYPEVFRAIAGKNYNGFVGLEYWPVDEPLQGLQDVVQWHL
ncbi:MAG: hydroxypyruvate isomerase [Pirellulaceae bacterium]|nr:MAG: hydroxypyruvate isomerase [Pirellulaceae bacterium]